MEVRQKEVTFIFEIVGLFSQCTIVTLAERKTVPELGWSSPAINLSIVDLPIPFGPTTANIEDINFKTKPIWQCHVIILTISPPSPTPRRYNTGMNDISTTYSHDSCWAIMHTIWCQYKLNKIIYITARLSKGMRELIPGTTINMILTCNTAVKINPKVQILKKNGAPGITKWCITAHVMKIFHLAHWEGLNAVRDTIFWYSLFRINQYSP